MSAPHPEPAGHSTVGLMSWVRALLLPAALIGVVVFLAFVPARISDMTTLSYSDFRAKVVAGQVAEVKIDEKGGVTGSFTSGRDFRTQLPTALGVGDLDTRLRAKGVKVTATRASQWPTLLIVALPFVAVGALYWYSRRAGSGASAASRAADFGRSKATVIDTERPATRFIDVAGYHGVKQEIGEVVDVLRAPAKYAAAGATGPRGVLMVGPPGTGKTLLARAVAGEAAVPFLAITGSEFVEMYVGIGASRVRNLFAEARKRAPAIVFIDEIDAIGGRRSGRSTLIGNDEREQTVNQLLAAMDGFDQTTGVVVLAATNQPDLLDAALLRPGRFDRQVTVPLPNQRERAEILAIHSRGKNLAADVDLVLVAKGTPGFSGAGLANLLNEAAILAVRSGRVVIESGDLDAARDRVLLGRRDGANVLLPEEKRAVAVHEAGHALVAASSVDADPVARVTILPAGASLGATEQLPEVERHLYSEAYLLDQLTVRLGGRGAELAVLGQASSGAADDLAGATRLARRMVSELGLSLRLGPVSYAAAGPDAGPWERPYSEATQQCIDAEVVRLLREAEQRALDLIRRRRPALDRLVAALIEHETLAGREVEAALAGCS